MNTEILQKNDNEQWAIIELMGRSQTAGRIEWGTLLKVDVPNKDGFVTEFYGLQSIYKIRIVSEEIARAYAPKETEVFCYDAPIVTLEQHQAGIRRIRDELDDERQKRRILEGRLTAVRHLVPIVGNEENAVAKEDAIPF